MDVYNIVCTHTWNKLATKKKLIKQFKTWYQIHLVVAPSLARLFSLLLPPALPSLPFPSPQAPMPAIPAH